MSDEVFSDNGYLPSNSDVQVTKATIPKTNLPLPARFKTCVQCRKQNSNPYFQYCCQCFKVSKSVRLVYLIMLFICFIYMNMK